ncbi:MAG TPA: hypothetical protein VJU61_14395 [Polyangiaceae bacterium]|nr:hypothetical protein [Polyangiaceae bacterium]
MSKTFAGAVFQVLGSEGPAACVEGGAGGVEPEGFGPAGTPGVAGGAAGAGHKTLNSPSHWLPAAAFAAAT